MTDLPPERTFGEYGNRDRNRARLATHNQPVIVNKFEIMKVDGCSEEGKRLRLFPLSLKDDAKEWLNSLPSDSITTWDELEDKLLEQYFSPVVFVRKRQEISSYKHKKGESFRDTYRRFKSLLAGCPNHAYDDTTQMQIFYNGLRPNTRIMLDATAGGSLNYKTTSEAHKIIEIMASNKQMMFYDRGFGLKSGCDFCGGAHKNGTCEVPDDDDTEELEEMNFVGNNGKQNNPHSSTYNLGWRNHLIFSWKDQHDGPQGQQGAQSNQATSRKDAWEIAIEKLAMNTSAFIEESRAVHKNHSASIKNQELEQIKAYAKFLKDIMLKKRKIGDETVILTEECIAILQRKLPPKLKNSGSFSIPCAIGDRTFGKTLCDIGVSVSLIPLSIYKRLGIGRVKDTQLMLQFADQASPSRSPRVYTRWEELKGNEEEYVEKKKETPLVELNQLSPHLKSVFVGEKDDVFFVSYNTP
ncbi:uncharacterized protein [Cicer arietinum]|uniref:uncharacterized protein n=1 Tax=Cicer arietinum TaxID=3827 RepID=UPI003CC6416E